MPEDSKTSNLAITQRSKVSLPIMGTVLVFTISILVAAFDFKGWVTEEIQATRLEQVQSSRAIEKAVTEMTVEIRTMGRDFSGLRETFIEQSRRALGVNDRLSKLEAEVEMLKARK